MLIVLMVFKFLLNVTPNVGIAFVDVVRQLAMPVIVGGAGEH